MTMLSRAIGRGQLHHGLLFIGPTGVGKAAVARGLACALHCSVSPGVGCGECTACKRILGGSSAGIEWIVPEGPGGMIKVDVARSLANRLAHAPFEGSHHVVVFDPGTALNETSLNALLKSIEEPVPGVHFVFIVESPEALLPTIVSRCLPVRFGALSEDDTATVLDAALEARAAAAAEEGNDPPKIPKARRELAMRLSQGSAGRAIELAMDETLDAALVLLARAVEAAQAGPARIFGGDKSPLWSAWTEAHGGPGAGRPARERAACARLTDLWLLDLSGRMRGREGLPGVPARSGDASATAHELDTILQLRESLDRNPVVRLAIEQDPAAAVHARGEPLAAVQAPQLTLAAALRDVTAKRQEARALAVANLAPALLAELSRPGPAWRAAADHPRGPEVIEALETIANADDEHGQLRGDAAIGLGNLGDAKVIDVASGWLTRPGDDPDVAWLRECALIALSFVGTAAPEDSDARTRALDQIRTAMRSEHADARFQAPIALVEVAGNDAESELCDALDREAHDMVRENVIEAMSRLDPPGARTCDALEILLRSDEGDHGLGFEAAMILADARRESARDRLLIALAVRDHRDRALEGLAALGRAPSAACDQVLAIARRWWLPGVTRVRAAYALVRMVGPDADREARAMLERFAWHPRPAVREAVADARKGLERLESED